MLALMLETNVEELLNVMVHCSLSVTYQIKDFYRKFRLNRKACGKTRINN